MKNLLILSISLCIVPPFHGSATSLSAITNGIYFAVGGWRGPDQPVTNEPVRFDDRLVWMMFCNTGRVEVHFHPEIAAYDFRVRMWGSDGKEVPKTSLGKTFGSKWDSLSTYTNPDGRRIGSAFAWGPFTENPELYSGKLLPAPRDLFKMEQPGAYVLEVQMQVFTFVQRGGVWARQVIGFSPVKIKVVRPPAEQAKQ